MNDLKNIPAVNRIIIGDVGSGKTIVAFIIALVYQFGLPSSQVALLAPTEVLSFQHYQSLRNLLKNPQLESQLGLDFVQTIFLSGKQVYLNDEKITRKKLDQRLLEIKQKSPETRFFWIGTQALLFQENIQPQLVLVDEQHRFGVRQRSFLTENQTGVHFLSFTATPIPRTLALTVYKSLKPHFLQTLSTRHKVHTSLEVFDNLETKVVNKISQEISQNRKVYVICAKVLEDEKAEDELYSVEKTVKILEKYFPGQILSVHGKMSAKKDILQEFKNSDQKNILVATTVIEVGVDVGMATLVIILNAERFGLSALHQIRGRVGRNDFADNSCILLTYPKYMRARRLQYLRELSDGFKLAEKDLQIRGSGDLLGNVQSGFENDIEELIGLDPILYNKIDALVDSIDFQNLDKSLPRLQNYIQKEASKVWGE